MKKPHAGNLVGKNTTALKSQENLCTNKVLAIKRLIYIVTMAHILESRITLFHPYSRNKSDEDVSFFFIRCHYQALS